MTTFVIKAGDSQVTMEVTVPGYDDLCEDVKVKFLAGVSQFAREFYGDPVVVVQQGESL